MADSLPILQRYRLMSRLGDGGHDARPAHADQMMTKLTPFRPRFEVPEGFLTWLLEVVSREPHRRFQLAADAAHHVSLVAEGTLSRVLHAMRRSGASLCRGR